MGYRNISLYKASRTRLLKQMYPDESSSIGKVIFKNSIYYGITARLWHDEISIKFSDEFLDVNNDFIETITPEFIVLKSMCDITIFKKAITLNPLGKDNFEDSKLGMIQRASFYVLILDLCLKIISKHLKVINSE